MIRLTLLTLASITLLGAATVEKSSALFSFPTSVSTVRVPGVTDGRYAFSHTPLAGVGILFRWSLPAGIRQGTITVYTLGGAVAARFRVDGSSGSRLWQSRGNQLPGQGMYLVHYRFQSFSGTVKLVRVGP